MLTLLSWVVPVFFLSDRSLFLDSNFVYFPTLTVSFISLALRSEKNSSEVGLNILCLFVSWIMLLLSKNSMYKCSSHK